MRTDTPRKYRSPCLRWPLVGGLTNHAGDRLRVFVSSTSFLKGCDDHCPVRRQETGGVIVLMNALNFTESAVWPVVCVGACLSSYKTVFLSFHAKEVGCQLRCMMFWADERHMKGAACWRAMVGSTSGSDCRGLTASIIYSWTDDADSPLRILAVVGGCNVSNAHFSLCK